MIAIGDPAKTVINGTGSGDVVVMNNVHQGGIIGFTIQSSSSGPRSKRGNNNGKSGIKCVGGNKSPAVANCIIKDNKNGITIGGNARPFIANNIITDNSGNGISISNNSPATIINNIIINNSALKIGKKTYAEISYNDVWNNGSTDYSEYFPDTKGNILSNPMLADPSSGNYRLSQGSPCIDAGHPDIKDTDGTRSDIGAYGRIWFNNPDDTDNDGIPDDYEMYYFGGLSHDETDDEDDDGMPDSWEIKYNLDPLDDKDASEDPDNDELVNADEYSYGTDPTNEDTDGDTITDGQEVENGTDPLVPNDDFQFTAGVYTVGESGYIGTDWLFDGGAYKGEVALFSLSGMEAYIPNSPEFIKEAARRSLTDSKDGHVVISDLKEGARCMGSLGESRNWNSGPYKGLKYFEMTPGDRFAIMLVPDSTVDALYQDPSTKNTRKRPLFSLASPNPQHEMYLGQIADIMGMGSAFVYEDLNYVNSDRDHNDVIFQLTGATGETPLLDSLVTDKPDWFDWRISSDLGRQIIEHLEVPPVQPEDLWMSVNLTHPGELTVYDPEDRFCSTE